MHFLGVVVLQNATKSAQKHNEEPTDSRRESGANSYPLEAITFLRTNIDLSYLGFLEKTQATQSENRSRFFRACKKHTVTDRRNLKKNNWDDRTYINCVKSLLKQSFMKSRQLQSLNTKEIQFN